MPEGPEIRREADKIQRAVGGRKALEVWCALDGAAKAAAELSGRNVLKVKSWGKAMLTYFEGEKVIYSHNQLYGKWYVKKARQTAKTRRSLRLAIHTEKRSALLYSASDIEVLETTRLHEHRFLKKLGPDLLSHNVDEDTLIHRLEDSRFAGRGLAGLLLDQAFVAGLGNYLRAEILHTSGIAPKRKPKDLNDREKALLAKEILRITRQSYKTAGITNDLNRVEILKEQGLTRRHYRFHVYQRDGKDCYRCGGEILRHDIGGRAMFWCARCQI